MLVIEYAKLSYQKEGSRVLKRVFVIVFVFCFFVLTSSALAYFVDGSQNLNPLPKSFAMAGFGVGLMAMAAFTRRALKDVQGNRATRND